MNPKYPPMTQGWTVTCRWTACGHTEFYGAETEADAAAAAIEDGWHADDCTWECWTCHDARVQQGLTPASRRVAEPDKLVQRCDDDGTQGWACAECGAWAGDYHRSGCPALVLLHFCSATEHCAGGRNDTGDWNRVTCPACRKSAPRTDL